MSLTTSVSVTISRTALERMLRLPGGLVYRSMERRLNRAEAVARATAPGSMSDHISSSIDGRGRNIVGRLESAHPATIYVIKGTRPHIIRPVRAKALRFMVGGRVVYARIVRHPGNAPNDFLTRALRAAR
jgi:hypothetical protein